MVPISQKIYLLDEIYNLSFDKTPMANPYNNYPFLIIENVLSKKECEKIIKSLAKETYKATLINKGLDESIRKTILHKPTDSIRNIFDKVVEKYKEKIEKFFNVRLLYGSDIQILEYKDGGFYKCHADNASMQIKDGKVVGFKEVNRRKITTLLFLNDDFEGGEIEFCFLRYNNNTRVILKPKVGEMIVFPSHGVFSHEVKKVKGNRFAIVKWWEII